MLTDPDLLDPQVPRDGLVAAGPAQLEAAAGILAVEAYHAGIIRTKFYDQGLMAPAQAISDARDSLDGQVLNIVYLTPNKVTEGGSFPDGVNGGIRRSS